MQRCSLKQTKTGEKLMNKLNCQAYWACKYYKSYIIRLKQWQNDEYS